MSARLSHAVRLSPLLRNHLKRLRTLYRRHKVRSLYAIGSVLCPADFRPDSDLDFLFAFYEDRMADTAYHPNLAAFWAALEQWFHRPVDLVHGPTLHNPYLIEALEATKQLVYDPSQETPHRHASS